MSTGRFLALALVTGMLAAALPAAAADNVLDQAAAQAYQASHGTWAAAQQQVPGLPDADPPPPPVALGACVNAATDYYNSGLVAEADEVRARGSDAFHHQAGELQASLGATAFHLDPESLAAKGNDSLNALYLQYNETLRPDTLRIPVVLGAGWGAGLADVVNGTGGALYEVVAVGPNEVGVLGPWSGPKFTSVFQPLNQSTYKFSQNPVGERAGYLTFLGVFLPAQAASIGLPLGPVNVMQANLTRDEALALRGIATALASTTQAKDIAARDTFSLASAGQPVAEDAQGQAGENGAALLVHGATMAASAQGDAVLLYRQADDGSSAVIVATKALPAALVQCPQVAR
jgi:hypothetical protein